MKVAFHDYRSTVSRTAAVRFFMAGFFFFVIQFITTAVTEIIKKKKYIIYITIAVIVVVANTRILPERNIAILCLYKDHVVVVYIITTCYAVFYIPSSCLRESSQCM